MSTTLDADLACALAADLQANFERLVVVFQDRMYGFALRLSSNPQDAEEIAQDAFVRAYNALRDYSPERVQALALRAWLYRIVLNVARNKVRGRRLQLVRLDGEPEDGWDEPADDAAAQPEAVFERVERAAELGVMLDALPERYRTPVILRHVEALSYADVALVLNQPVGTIKSNVHRGVQLLREALRPELNEVHV